MMSQSDFTKATFSKNFNLKKINFVFKRYKQVNNVSFALIKKTTTGAHNHELDYNPNFQINKKLCSKKRFWSVSCEKQNFFTNFSL